MVSCPGAARYKACRNGATGRQFGALRYEIGWRFFSVTDNIRGAGDENSHFSAWKRVCSEQSGVGGDSLAAAHTK
jgi:hypothetical protein